VADRFDQLLAVADEHWYAGADVFADGQRESDTFELGDRVANQFDAGAFLVWAGTSAQEVTGIEYARAEDQAIDCPGKQQGNLNT
jgi:hypothetical protein